VEEVVELLLVYLRIDLSGSRKPQPLTMRAVPAVEAVAGDRERTPVERLAVVVQLG
jgi:hypothetical protein